MSVAFLPRLKRCPLVPNLPILLLLCAFPFYCRAVPAQSLAQADWTLLSPRTTDIPFNGFYAHSAEAVYDDVRQQGYLFAGYADASSSNSLTEVYSWDGQCARRVSSSKSPTGRGGFDVACDTARHRCVLFGGMIQRRLSDSQTVSVFFNDTWEWDGLQWHRMTPVHQPPARAEHAMIYDSSKKAVMLYGGTRYSASGIIENYGDTWEWDGTDWRQLHPVASPGLRSGHEMVYATKWNKTIMFSGSANNVLTSDTWEWSGSNWIRVTPLLSPIPRHQHSMVFDGNRNKVVLSGGTKTNNSHINDTWEWDGTNWKNCAPILSPPAYGYRLVYDTKIHCTTIMSDTMPWFWNGALWTRSFPNGTPRLTGAAMAYNTQSRTALLFGGEDGQNVFDDTLEWDGSQWTRLHPANHPPAQCYSAMVYDSSHNRMILFGKDTWAWSKGNWTQLDPPTKPPGRSHHAMAYDNIRNRIVLFGGYTKKDTWEFDGTDWFLREPQRSPPSYYDHCMAYDRKRGRVVMCGGYYTTIYVDDHGRIYDWEGNDGKTWEWDGINWTQFDSCDVPEDLTRAAMAYDENRQRVVMLTNNNLLLEWNGRKWDQIETSFPFTNRSSASMVYETANHRFLLVGGSYQSDTWGLVFPARASRFWLTVP